MSALGFERPDQPDGAPAHGTPHPVAELANPIDHVSPEASSNKALVAVVVHNHALRRGKRLHRDLAMGRTGSLPPAIADEHEAEHVEFLIGEMRSGGGLSLGSFVAGKVDFEKAWALIAESDRVLLDLKYAEGLTSKEIAERLGRKPGTIDNQLTAANRGAILLFASFLIATGWPRPAPLWARRYQWKVMFTAPGADTPLMVIVRTAPLSKPSSR